MISSHQCKNGEMNDSENQEVTAPEYTKAALLHRQNLVNKTQSRSVSIPHEHPIKGRLVTRFQGALTGSGHHSPLPTHACCIFWLLTL